MARCRRRSASARSGSPSMSGTMAASMATCACSARRPISRRCCRRFCWSLFGLAEGSPVLWLAAFAITAGALLASKDMLSTRSRRVEAEA